MSINETGVVARPEELIKLDKLFAEGVDFVDRHLREVQYGIYGIGALGGLIAIRSLRLFGRFKRVKDVPKSYISKNQTLRGTVRRINPETGALMVEHIPIVQIGSKTKPDHQLPIVLTGVKAGALGYQWLDVAVRNAQVQFTLVTVNSNQQLESVVKPLEGLLKNRCLNTEIVKLGLGQVAPMIKELRKNETYYKTYNRMLQLESKALQERNGIWSTIPTTSSWWSTYMNLLSRVLDKVRYSVRILNKSATKAVG